MSLKKSWPAWVFLGLLVVGAFFVDRHEQQVQAVRDAERDTKLIDGLNKAFDKQTDTILKAIRNIGGPSNATAKP